MSRYSARVHVFNLVFQMPFYTEWERQQLEDAINLYLECLPDLKPSFKGIGIGVNLTEEEQQFIREEVCGVFSNLPQLDEQISSLLQGWDFDRISKMDLALLRLAIYEILFEPDITSETEITSATAINQAVELAKTYGTDNSHQFVNGLLGKVVKKNG